jgi:ligand-binding sensor domain-containing protein
MRKLLLIVTGLVCFGIYVTAQIIPFQNYYTLHDGLPSKTILDIEQDKLGYLWFAHSRSVSSTDITSELLSEDGLPIIT